MGKARRTNLFLVLVMSIIAMFSAFFGVVMMPKSENVLASAETVEYQDLLGIENRDWGAASDEYYFGGVTLSPFEWFNSADSVSGCWYHGNDALVAANNGVDILKYIYVNDKSARDAITENVNAGGPLVGTNGWLTNPAASPVYVETTNGSGIIIKILKSYAGDTFTITFKAGFSLIRNDGAVIYVSDDIIYNCVGNVPTKVQKSTVTFTDENGATVATKRVANGTAVGELPAVPAKAGYVGFWKVGSTPLTAETVISTNRTATPVYALEYQDTFGLEDRTSWGAHEGEYYFGGINLTGGYFNTAAAVNGTWYVGNATPISGNNGVDIMEYIYVNGASARQLITENANGERLSNACSCWLSNPAAYPVYVETTNGSGLIIRVAKAYTGDAVTITFKAGFSLIRNDGETIYLSNDVTYTYANGGLVREQKYTLTFEGVEDRRILAGDVIGELPAVPAMDGYEGVWTIDGVEITADTVYTYNANKTAVVKYTKETKDITDIFGVEDRTSWGAHEGEYYFGGINYVSGTYFNTAAVSGTWYVGNDAIIAANNGVDIMEYIYVNGVSARKLITDNANGARQSNACGCWLSNPAAYPVYVETTTGSGIIIRLAKAYTGDTFTLTFKAGFSLMDANGDVCVLTDSVQYTYANGALTRTVLKEYVLSFEGLSDTLSVKANVPIGTLPAVPAMDGYEGVWTIDGVEITADTVYNYNANKTAVAQYTKVIATTDVTDSVKIEFSSWKAVSSQFKIFITPATSLCANNIWNIQGWDTGLINKNNGVDIMEYIYVNGQSVRQLSNDNRTNNTYPVGDATGWFTNSDQCRPVFVETNGEGIWVSVLHSFSSETYTVTLKAGFAIMDAAGGVTVISEDVDFICSTGGGVAKVGKYTLTFEGADYAKTVKTNQAIGELPELPTKDGEEALYWAIDGTEITADTLWMYGENKTATPVYLQKYTLSFKGIADTIQVAANEAMGELPAVPTMNGYDGYWTIDGVEIDENSVYAYGMDKTAVAAYRKDITKYLAIEDRAWGAHAGEYYFGILDMREANKVGDAYYLNSTVCGTWYVGNNAVIEANNGVDIMEYILINGVSARKLITDNANGAGLTNACNCWLSNPAASPVYVETTNGSGIMLRVLASSVKTYFEITIKSGFSLIDAKGATVYLTEDVTYKYIINTLSKGEITDAELDALDGQKITLKDGEGVYFEKTTCRMVLPALTSEIKEGEALSLAFVGWTTDPEGLSNLYPAGYALEPEQAIELHAVWIGFDLQDGAAVRLSANSNGIRFLTDIDANAYKLGVSKGLIIGVGTFVVPTEYLYTGVEFVHESFPEGYYIDRATDTWKTNGEGDAVWTYAAAFVGISEGQFAKKLSARGYLKIQFTTGEGYVYTPYTEELNSRSIYDVALAAYNDAENPQYKTDATILNYINKVANLVWDYESDTFAKANVAGNYEVASVSRAEDGYVVNVMMNGDVKSAMVNNVRIPETSFENLQVGEFIFRVGKFTLIDGGFQFTLEAANTTYDKESAETLSFKSSDSDLDFFLNDFFKRHSGYVENGSRDKVNSTVAGVNSQEFFSQEWMSMSYYWYNSFEGYTNEVGNNEDRIAGLRKFLSSVPVDDYGYVWSSNDNVRDTYSEVSTGEQKMGWPFPNNDTVKTAHWEFNGGDSGSITNNISAKISDGLYTANVSNQSSNVTFTLTAPTSKKVYTFYAPLLEFEVRMDDATNVEDIYVWYTTNSSSSFGEDKKVSVKDKAFMNYDLGNTTGAYNHVLYLPLYAESAWGESTSTYMKKIKVEIVLKSGKTLSGNVGLNYVRPTLDTRMSNNNSILISSLRQDYDYTGDLDYLTENVTRARKAMNFLMQMYDASRGLKKESYLVGHGGTKKSLNWLGNATAESIASSISQGYWDIMYMPEYDFQSNTYFYKAVRDMAYLEEVLAENGITVEEDATVKTATRNRTTGTCAYSYDLNAIADTVLASLRQTTENTNHTGFWNATDGRFVAGYASGEGKWYDYGYVAWNLEAIYYGIATEAQAQSIMNWLASEKDLYKYIFAPQSITVTGDADALNGEYAAQGDKWVNCQFGGAILYTSFYDLMARLDTFGADNAFERLTAIQEWYEEIYNYYVANGTDPYDFYRYYYDSKGIQCQGMGTAGQVGLDREFLESFLPVSAVAYGFFGIEASGDNLTVAPQLPADLSYWKMENLAFNFVKYDLTIYKNAIQLNNVRGDAKGLTLTVALDYTKGQSVYVNGKKLQSGYTVENGKVLVTVALGATIVEVR